MVYGMAVGPTNAAAENDDDELEGASRAVGAGQRVSPAFLVVDHAMGDYITSSLSTQRKTLRLSGH